MLINRHLHGNVYYNALSLSKKQKNNIIGHCKFPVNYGMIKWLNSHDIFIFYLICLCFITQFNNRDERIQKNYRKIRIIKSKCYGLDLDSKGSLAARFWIVFHKRRIDNKPEGITHEAAIRFSERNSNHVWGFKKDNRWHNSYWRGHR